MSELGVEGKVRPVLRRFYEIDELVQCIEGLLAANRLKSKTGQPAFQRKKALGQLEHCRSKLLVVKAKQLVLLNQRSPCGLFPFRIEVAESAKDTIATAPSDKVIPEGLLLALHELEERMCFRIVAQREGLGGVPNQQVRNHEASAFIRQLLERRPGIIAELFLLLFRQSFVVEALEMEQDQERAVLEKDDRHFMVQEVNIEKDVFELLFVPVDVSQKIAESHVFLSI